MGDSVTRYVRYEHGRGVSYGILDGETIKEIDGGLFGERVPTGKTVQLGDVKLRYPCEPTKVLCVGLNYRSHLGDHPAPTNPEIFYKPPTALTDPGDDIVFPPGARDVHYEAELVVVVGKTAKGISAEDADDHIFGYTCGNDVSEPELAARLAGGSQRPAMVARQGQRHVWAAGAGNCRGTRLRKIEN